MSHGLMANRSLYSTICLELASFGYIVFAIDHHDGSGSYSQKLTGEEVRFDTTCPRETGMNGACQQHLYRAINERKIEIDELVQMMR